MRWLKVRETVAHLAICGINFEFIKGGGIDTGVGGAGRGRRHEEGGGICGVGWMHCTVWLRVGGNHGRLGVKSIGNRLGDRSVVQVLMACTDSLRSRDDTAATERSAGSSRACRMKR